MCTVSYIPYHEGFILTSNRDESPFRETIKPRKIQLNTHNEVFAPLDKENGGTWIALDVNRKKAACLLNGAFVKHHRKLPYRKSRGLIVLESFQHPSFAAFVNAVSLENIEPFTLILAEKDNLRVLVWDGVKKHEQILDSTKSYLWSSSTLYNIREKQEKEKVFENFLENFPVAPNTVFDLHGKQQKPHFILDREEVKTVSITQILVNTKKASLNYYPLPLTKEFFFLEEGSGIYETD
ncbi:NRDE family protein [Ascidiimonas aurantiaca]|uniref:NRDE family protein n=1 Tax=Ascidiimonas aurantiaca TaxID=1685432 RepID=UPI0030EE5942